MKLYAEDFLNCFLHQSMNKFVRHKDRYKTLICAAISHVGANKFNSITGTVFTQVLEKTES
jgi:hypothetical protein